jgi:hypothetical protein
METVLRKLFEGKNEWRLMFSKKIFGGLCLEKVCRPMYSE